MSYGVYFSFDGRRWYFACECEVLYVAFGAAHSAATLRSARFARVTDKNDVPIWEVSL
jgi:hypothetical protein